MKHLELHILQSVPVSCLNRDDLNSPKTAIFGGVQRARVSSQCWKRAIREMARIEAAAHFQGDRTKLLVGELKKYLIEKGISDDNAHAMSFCVGHYLAKIDSKDPSKVKTLVYLSKNEYKNIAEKLSKLTEDQKEVLVQSYLQLDTSKIAEEDSEDNVLEDEDEIETKKAKGSKDKLSPKKFLKNITKELKQVFKDYNKNSLHNDAADIALFGRMVANEPNINLEGAAMFSHAISTHKADNEIDFFTAVDDLQPHEEPGAGMMGTLEYNSATYYRFAALNLDMLADESHLNGMSQDERKEVVKTFIKSTLMAMPSARRNSMNGNTLPGYVKCIVREKGHPIQLVNAFENPVKLKEGKSFFEVSVERLNNEYTKNKETWGLDEILCVSIPDAKLDDILKKVESHVK